LDGIEVGRGSGDTVFIAREEAARHAFERLGLRNEAVEEPWGEEA